MFRVEMTIEELQFILNEMQRDEVEKITMEVDDYNWSVDFDIYKNGNYKATVFITDEGY